jgi:YhcH/YjgK/YiaL family protein
VILDRLENAGSYTALSTEIAMALDYLHRTDFSQVPDGRYELDGDRVYAIVMRYKPKPAAEAVWEAHRKYLDVQYMVAGVERMGYAPLNDGLPTQHAYDAEKDFILYDAKGDLFEVPAGSFAIFGPQDVHAPSLARASEEAATEVQKVCVKCRVA